MATFAIRPIGEQYNTASTRFHTPDVDPAADFLTGAFVVLNGEVIEEAGTNPALIYGVATADAKSYDWVKDTHGHGVPAVPVALANQEFRGTLLGTFNAAADIGTNYGVTKDSSGYWVVDKSKTGANARVTVTGTDRIASPTDGGIIPIEDGDINVPVTFVIIPANRQVA